MGVNVLCYNTILSSPLPHLLHSAGSLPALHSGQFIPFFQERHLSHRSLPIPHSLSHRSLFSSRHSQEYTFLFCTKGRDERGYKANPKKRGDRQWISSHGPGSSNFETCSSITSQAALFRVETQAQVLLQVSRPTSEVCSRDMRGRLVGHEFERTPHSQWKVPS